MCVSWILSHTFRILVIFRIFVIPSLNYSYSGRLGISYPELTEMQVRAILQAAVTMSNQGFRVFPEIMIPLVGTPQACHSSSSFINFFNLKFLVSYLLHFHHLMGTGIKSSGELSS